MNPTNQPDLELLNVTREFIKEVCRLPEADRKEIHDYLIAECGTPVMQHYIESVFVIVEGR